MKKSIAIIAALLCLFLCGCPRQAPAESLPETSVSTQPSLNVPQSVLKVHFIDVGHADCILLECDNSFALVDGGNAEDGKLIVEYLKKQGVQKLNLVVGTHPHEDHIGGLPTVMDHFPVSNVWFSATPYTNHVVRSFLSSAEAQDEPVQQVQPGQVFHLGRTTITVLGPVKTDYEDVNDLSLVLMVQFGETRFLLTGDMEQIAETDLLDSGADVKADVLKVGHHGSYSSTGYRFLWNVMPKYAVIFCEKNNEYGHPHDGPMSRLRDAEVEVFRTDRMSHIVAVSDGKNITFSWANQQNTLSNAA